MLICVLFNFDGKAQHEDSDISKVQYEEAKIELTNMLANDSLLNFKRAVFVTENAYLGNSLDYKIFCRNIENLKRIAQEIIKKQDLVYDFSDKEKVSKYSAVYTLMTDTLTVALDSNLYALHFPYGYDFEDFNGVKDWSKMFVSKLLANHSGNCHSLPFLYKIIVEELGERAYLALAPNHIYIKLQSEKMGWYNTELTCAAFPIDAWLMTSGYIHMNAIKSGIYMDALNQKQSVALCLVDLAKGYERKFGTGSGDFIIECCDLALEYFPHYINAWLLKAETQKKIFVNLMKQSNAKEVSELFISNSSAKKLFKDMERNYGKIHKFGYRKIPDEMYFNWLQSLKTEREKYTNRNMNPSFKN
jgi:hypothetical protein